MQMRPEPLTFEELENFRAWVTRGEVRPGVVDLEDDRMLATIDALTARAEQAEDILHNACGHLGLPHSESGPADDPRLYDRALEGLKDELGAAQHKKQEHADARWKAESRAEQAERERDDWKDRCAFIQDALTDRAEKAEAEVAHWRAKIDALAQEAFDLRARAEAAERDRDEAQEGCRAWEYAVRDLKHGILDRAATGETTDLLTCLDILDKGVADVERRTRSFLDARFQTVVSFSQRVDAAEREAIEAAENEAVMAAERDRLRGTLAYVEGCFAAAEVEGLYERLAEQTDKEPGSLFGLVTRRLLPILSRVAPEAFRDRFVLDDKPLPQDDGIDNDELLRDLETARGRVNQYWSAWYKGEEQS